MCDVTSVLSSVRSRLLDFVLELKDQTPFAGLRSPCCRLLQHGKHSAINDLKNYYSM